MRRYSGSRPSAGPASQARPAIACGAGASRAPRRAFCESRQYGKPLSWWGVVGEDSSDTDREDAKRGDHGADGGTRSARPGGTPRETGTRAAGGCRGPARAGDPGRRTTGQGHELRDRGQARRRAHRHHGAARRGPPPARGRPRGRQDHAGQDPRPLDRLLGAPRAVHPRPAAERHHRRQRLQPGRARLRVPPRRDLRQRRRRRRDQPGLPEDPVGPARVHGGGTGHRRRPDLQPPPALHRDGDAEPHRDGGHLPPARGAARPLHGADLPRLPLGPGRAGHARHATGRAARSSTSPRSPTPPRSRAMVQAVRGVYTSAAIKQYVVDLVGRHALEPGPAPRRLAPSDPAAAAGLPGPRRARRDATTSCRTTSSRSPSRCWPTGSSPPARPSWPARAPPTCCTTSCGACRFPAAGR